MGCFFSTNKASKKCPTPTTNQHLLKGLPVLESDTFHVEQNYSKSPPPLEEETVKEVLSETPAPKPPFPKIEEDKTTKLSSLPKIKEEKKIEKSVPVNAVDEISEISEICSLSESVSTTTVTERREEEDMSRDDGEVRQRLVRSPAKIPRKRSVYGEFAGRIERGGKSPVRRLDPSPGRRNDNREVGPTARRRISSNVQRRDPGEISARRSRSPATRTGAGANRPALCRSPSSKRTGQSPGRTPAPLPENRRKIEETKEGNWPANESLEDSLVSLECFIFL